MWNEPSKEELNQLPRLYETENVPLAEKPVGMHFLPGRLRLVDFRVRRRRPLLRLRRPERRPEEMGEWGYISLTELKSLKIGPGIEVDRDLHWEIKPAQDIPAIARNLRRESA